MKTHVIPYKVLLIEDHPIDQKAFIQAAKAFKNELAFEIVDSIHEAKMLLENKSFDGVIADYRLRDGVSFQIIDTIKSIPFILMTGTGDEYIASSAFKHGAYDYIIKDIDRNYIKSLPSIIIKAIKLKRAQEQLHLFESIIVHLTDAVMVAEKIGADYEVIYTNDAFTNITNYSREDAFGQSIYMLAGDETSDIHFSNIVEKLVERETYKGEVIFHKKENQPFWTDVSFVPIEHEGKPLLYFAIIKDISESKKIELDLRSAIAEAEKASSAEQQFLASMSHEIRTPMNAVVGMTHLLADTTLDAQQKDYLNALKYSGERMMWIISDILDLSKIHADKIEFNQDRFNLYELLLDLQSAFLYKLNNRKIDITIDLDILIANDVIGDEYRLRQILTNLLAKATERTYENEIVIKIKLLNSHEDDYVIEFEVKDNGEEMTPKELETLFDSFTGENDEIKDNLKITTLGLSVSKKLVERLGGKIWVETSANNGSTYHFILPLKNSGKLSSVDPVNDSWVDEQSKKLEDLYILIAEDNLMNRKLISGMLSQWNCQFDIVNNGKEAVDKFHEKAYDVVFMDINMPVMDGYEATIRIRESEHPNKDIPIIALTAAVLSTEKEKVFLAGMNEYITKPFNPKKLKETVLNLILEKEEIEEEINTETITSNLKQEKNQLEYMLNIDLNYLKEFSGGDSGFMKEMIAMFLEQMPQELSTLSTLLTNEEWYQIGKLAHKMKPNYLMMGMEDQKDIAKSIEEMCLGEDIDTSVVKKLSAQLIADTEAAMPLIETELVKFI
jgi:PAS domain S-box-containing protein